MENRETIQINNSFARTHLEFFPSIAWLIFAQNKGNISIDIYETFPRQTFRNRCLLLSANGVQSISVPIKRNKNERTISKDAQINWKEDWNVRAWRAIYSNYGKSPFFEYYDLEIKKILDNKYRFLLDLNLDILEFIKKKFALDFNIFFTDNYIREEENNFMNAFRCQTRIEDGKLLSSYFQSFSDKFDFEPNLSCLDLLFSMGKEGGTYIRNEKIPMLLN